MAMKKLTAAFCALLLLLLFLPVFAYVIFQGTRMDYHAIYKIVTLYDNVTLIAAAVCGGVLVCLLYGLLKRLPVNRYTLAGSVVFILLFCAAFYLIGAEVCKCIAFYGGWDCGMVANSARWVYEGSGLGYDDYYTIYSNNVPITWLLYQLYSLAEKLPGYAYHPEFMWIQFQCLMFALAVLFSALIPLVAVKSIALSGTVLLVSGLLLGLTPWKIIPYTDGSTIAVAVFLIFLYAVFQKMRSKLKYVLWALLILAGVLGGIMKATCYVTLIAIVLVDAVWSVFGKEAMKQKLLSMGMKVLVLLAACLLAVACKNGMYQDLHYQYDADMEMTWTNYMYNGLNEANTGTVSGDGLSIVRAYAGYPREVRVAVEVQYIKDRIREKGIAGLLDFWLRKQVMNYNDGTFSWYQEGFFQAWEYEDITDSRYQEPLRQFYWQDGSNYLWFTTISQGLWLLVLLGVIVEAGVLLVTVIRSFRKDDTENTEDSTLALRTIGTVIFIGVFLFVMLFEGRARYLFNHIPVFAVTAVIGYCQLAEYSIHLLKRVKGTVKNNRKNNRQGEIK